MRRPTAHRGKNPFGYLSKERNVPLRHSLSIDNGSMDLFVGDKFSALLDKS